MANGYKTGGRKPGSRNRPKVAPTDVPTPVAAGVATAGGGGATAAPIIPASRSGARARKPLEAAAEASLHPPIAASIIPGDRAATDPAFPKYRTVATDKLVPYANNARTHSKAQISKIAASIKEFGFTNPVLTDGKRGIIAGHGRVLAAQILGMATVPTIELSHLSKAQRRAYVLAVNRLALDAGWDDELLALELGELREDGFNLELTGFDLGELSSIFGEDENAGLTDPDEVPPVPAVSVSVLGDVWILGKHRLHCADCMDVLPTLSGIDAVVTDPPYGIGAAKSNAHSRIRDRAAWPAAAWDDTPASPEAISAILALGVPAIIWGGNYFALPPGRGWLVWNKLNPPGFTMADAELGWSNINAPVRMWSGRPPGQDTSVKAHPTQKPQALMVWCIEQLPKQAMMITDPYAGSGTTIIAAEMTGRACHAIELSPAYVDVAVKRWQAFTGQEATHATDGRTFAAIALARAAPAQVARTKTRVKVAA